MFRVVIVGAVCLGCGARQHPTDKPDEYLAQIVTEGNRGIATADLIDGLSLHRAQHEGHAADPYAISQDTERVRGEFHRHGYFDVDVRSRLDHNGLAQTVVFTIVEGRRSTAHVEIEGLPPDVPLADVRALIPLAEGAPYDYDVYDDAKQTITEYLQNQGFARAYVDAKTTADRAHGTANAVYDIAPGSRCTFGDVALVGVDPMLAEAVAHRVTMHKGDRFSAKAVLDTQTALYAMTRFSTVRIEPDITGEGAIIPVKIALAEGSRHEVHFGGGLGYDPLFLEVRGRAGGSVIAPRLFDHTFSLTTVGVDARLGYAMPREGNVIPPSIHGGEFRGRGALTAHRIDLLDTLLTGDAELGVQYQTNEAYTYYGPYLRLGLSYPLYGPVAAPKIAVQVGWQLDAFAFDADDVVTQRLGLDGYKRLLHGEFLRDGTYQARLLIDLRDKVFGTRSGVYASVQFSDGGPEAGGTLRYYEVVPDLRGYVPLGPFVLAGRARVGAINGDVPPTERFYAGGAPSNRGFPTRTLSPTVLDVDHTVVIGGAGLIETSAELRWPFAIGSLDLELVGFTDAGDVTDTVGELDPLHLHVAVGGGLRWVIGGIAIGFDIAKRINRRGPTEPDPGDWGSWDITLGEAY
jgi:outer membrane protein assembly factor BamA